jgi:hypothetical protein
MAAQNRKILVSRPAQLDILIKIGPTRETGLPG